MTENKHAIATDLKRLDAHVVAPAEYKDAPELTDAQLAAADVYEGGKLIRRGRPPSASRKLAVKLRLDPKVLEYFRASGPGWQTRINAALARVAARTMVAKVTIKKAAKAKAAKAKRKMATRRAARSLKTRRSANRSLHG